MSQRDRVGVQVRKHARIHLGRIVGGGERLVRGLVDHPPPVVRGPHLNAQLERLERGRRGQRLNDALIDRRSRRPAGRRRADARERPRVERAAGEHAADSVLVPVPAAPFLKEPLDDHQVPLMRRKRRQDGREGEAGLAPGRRPLRRERPVGREHDDEALGGRGRSRPPRRHRLQPGERDRGPGRAAQDRSSGDSFHGASGGRLRKAAIRTVWRTICLKSPPGPVSVLASALIAQRSPLVCSLRPKA